VNDERKSETLVVETGEDLEAKPIASSAVPETKSSKDGAIKKESGEKEDIPLKELWAELVKDGSSKQRSKSSKISHKDLKVKEQRMETDPGESYIEPRKSKKRVKRPKSTNSNKPIDKSHLPAATKIDKIVNDTLNSL